MVAVEWGALRSKQGAYDGLCNVCVCLCVIIYKYNKNNGFGLVERNHCCIL